MIERLCDEVHTLRHELSDRTRSEASFALNSGFSPTFAHNKRAGAPCTQEKHRRHEAELSVEVAEARAVSKARASRLEQCERRVAQLAASCRSRSASSTESGSDREADTDREAARVIATSMGPEEVARRAERLGREVGELLGRVAAEGARARALGDQAIDALVQLRLLQRLPPSPPPPAPAQPGPLLPWF
eukprot:tig00001299_g8078.t1